MESGSHRRRWGRDGWKRGSGCTIGRAESRAEPRSRALNGVGEGLNVLVGALWGPGSSMEVEGEALEWGKGPVVCTEQWAWLVLQDVEAKTMRLEEHGKVVLVLERASQGAGPSRPPTPGRNR